MKIYDRYVVIKDYDDPAILDVDEDKLEKLDNMLNEYNIPHFFTYPIFEGKDPDPEEAAARLIYGADDEMNLELVYCLWASIHRNMPREKIIACFAKKAKRMEISLGK